MFFEHDGEQVSISVEGRSHTQSVLAFVRMEPSGRTVAGLGCTIRSAIERVLWRLSEVFCDLGRPPLSGEEEERVLSEVIGETPSESGDRCSTIPAALAIRPMEGRNAENSCRVRQSNTLPSPPPEGTIARAAWFLRRRARWLTNGARVRVPADAEGVIPCSGMQRPARVSTPTPLLPVGANGSGAAVEGGVVMEIESGGVRVRVPDRVNPHYVAALVAALASR
jgi:hypothetical protein